jgi:branched-chain amino acid transport system substrate-binding protein
MAGGAAAIVAAPFVIRWGFAQRAAVNIGVIEPLSGANAQFGINSLNGIEFVADEVNAVGGALGGAKINLVVSDATSNLTRASTAAQRLISENELTAMIGAFASSLTLAVSEVTARADIPMLTASFADEITGRGLENVFRIAPKATVIGRAQVNYTLAIAEAAGSKIEKIAIMYEDTAYGTAQSRGLRRAGKDANIEVVMDEPYPFGITDATPLKDCTHCRISYLLHLNLSTTLGLRGRVSSVLRTSALVSTPRMRCLSTCCSVQPSFRR